MINIKEKMGTCGRFNLIVRKAQTNEIVRETGWFDNLVLDQGLDAMANGSWFASCKVGTGNSTPVATQTQLDAYKALSINVQTETRGASSVAPYYKWSRKTFRFKAGDFNNTNLSEVAIGLGGTGDGAGIWNRALIKDGLGNPTVLTVLADEVLDVLCEIRVYQSQADINGHFNLLDKNGNIIHNDSVVRELAEKGVHSVDNLQSLSAGDTLIIRAHGAPPAVYEACESRGIRLIDATCPYVKRIHKIVNSIRKNSHTIC